MPGLEIAYLIQHAKQGDLHEILGIGEAPSGEWQAAMSPAHESGAKDRDEPLEGLPVACTDAGEQVAGRLEVSRVLRVIRGLDHLPLPEFCGLRHTWYRL